MHKARDDFFTGPAFAGDQDGGRAFGNLCRQSQGFGHLGIAMDQGVAFFGHGLENGGDQVSLRRQGDKFLRPGFDGVDRTIDIVANAACDDGNTDAFLGHGRNKRCHIKGDIGHDNINAVASPQDI